MDGRLYCDAGGESRRGGRGRRRCNLADLFPIVCAGRTLMHQPTRRAVLQGIVGLSFSGGVIPTRAVSGESHDSGSIKQRMAALQSEALGYGLIDNTTA